MRNEFKNAIKVNTKNREIVLTKKFEKASTRFGTEEYDALQEVRTAYPNYRVVVKKTQKKKESFKGLTYSFMENYIATHDNSEAIMDEYNNLRGFSEAAVALGMESVSYGEIKEWFLNKYPEIRAFHEKREAILKSVA